MLSVARHPLSEAHVDVAATRIHPLTRIRTRSDQCCAVLSSVLTGYFEVRATSDDYESYNVRACGCVGDVPSTMQCGALYFMCVAVCCLHAASEPLQTEDYREAGARTRRSEEKDGLALSREIFRNITKQLRQNINREGATDKTDRLLPNKPDDRHHAPYQAYHHHEHHWGPYFEGDAEGGEGASQVTAHVGAEALLHCRVGMLKDKTVMWLRRTSDSAQLLTVGPAPYAGDSRIAVKFQYPNNWRLSINPVRKADGGLYMCQISTHPPRAILANLTVLPPILTINGDETHEVKDRFYKAGSSISLACIISEDYVLSLPSKPPTTTELPTTTTPSTTTTELTTKLSTVFNRIDLVMNKSWSVETTTITSTVSISTTTKKEPPTTAVTATVATTTTKPLVVNNVFGVVWKKQGKDLVSGVTWRNFSATINVASASQNDSGTYSCHLQNHSLAIVNVHVLMAGENQAAVHHDTWNKGSLFWTSQNVILASITPFVLIISYK
ncbi:unnamed protein product [Plutella xylostella]|uniref:(diamondback moth) hypothetical protein n=1 Tax=Plutella xylostella TaxID=51655 RepID=A0A8S4ENS2_PLUXY|nr:unnamed protein product [Plutella xylostella]